MIQITTNIDTVSRQFEQIVKAMDKNPVKAAWGVAESIKMNAKLLAPHRSGALSSGVRIVRHKKGATVYAYDPKGRASGMLPMWANRQLAFNFRKRNKFFRSPQIVVYGDPSAKTRNGNPVRWTGYAQGDAGYFTLAVRRGRKVFGNRMTSAVKSAIQGIEI